MSRWRGAMMDVEPMLASLNDPPVVGDGLVYEPKYDGVRALAAIEVTSPPAGRPESPRRRTAAAPEVTVALLSRNGRDKQAQFPEITAALADLGRRTGRPLLLDGEIVAVDAQGRPRGFQHIQGRIHLKRDDEIAAAQAAQPTVFIAFDLLRDGDEDLRGLPLAARRLRLQEIVPTTRKKTALVRLSEIALDDGREMLQRARDEGWEGLIVKDGHAPYRSGRRTPAWRKLKLLGEQEFVIGGWTEPRESRQHFGSLLLGYYAGDDLIWAGHVGTGFTHADLDHLARLLRTRARRTSPFAGPVTPMAPPHWVRPDLVAQVRFTEWTSDGVLRHPVFLGLRDDKPAREVTRESTGRQADRPAIPAPAIHKRRRRPSPPSRSPSPATDIVVDQLLELEDAGRDGTVQLPNGDTLHVTNLSKIFWPALGITKGELLRYYAQVAPLILPVVDDRPLVMRRFPHGVGQQAFYQQRHPDAPPPGVRRETLPADVEVADEDGPRERLIGGSITTLLYMTQLAAISQDPWFSRLIDPHHPDFAAIDLDPGEGVTFAQVLDVARWVKDELDRHGIPAVPKTSGSTGLHIYIRLPPQTPYETSQLLCRMLATDVAAAHPKAATVERFVKRRRARTVYVDFLQNILGKTLACAYSARASDYAGVSTPLTWDEVAGSIDPRDFTLRTAPARFAAVGDLWNR